ncbi:Flotillin [Gracilaria domingensis]|nr:Flotillin [Gracilaria domingensis]
MPSFLRGFVYTAGPNTALIKSSGKKHVSVIIGGRMFAIPFLQRVDKLGLELRTITVHTEHGTTVNGVSVNVTSCCQVKIQGWSTTDEGGDDLPPHHARVGGDLHMDQSAIRLAAQHFIGKRDSEIEDSIQKTVAGHQRSIIGSLTVEELYRDRATFSRRVLELCHNDMRNMGLTIVSYTVAEIADDNGYIKALGVDPTENVKRAAVEGRATHQSEAAARKTVEETKAEVRMNEQKQVKIVSDQQTNIKKAEAQKEIDKHIAAQKKAFGIADAEQDKILLVRKKEAKAAEAQAELEVMKQYVEKERLLKEQSVHVEADAKLYKARVDADGVRATAAADAEKIRLLGNAEAEKQSVILEKVGIAKAEVEAEKIKRTGDATADVIRAKGAAEVEVELKRAEALRAKGMAENDVLQRRLYIWQEQYVTLSSLIYERARTIRVVHSLLTYVFYLSLAQCELWRASRQDDRYDAACGGLVGRAAV